MPPAPDRRAYEEACLPCCFLAKVRSQRRIKEGAHFGPELGDFRSIQCRRKGELIHTHG